VSLFGAARASLLQAGRVKLCSPSAPERRRELTSQGHPRTIFRRALQRGNLVVAEATAPEIGRVFLDEALELTLLIAQKEPHRHGRVAARWLRRYLEEREQATIDDSVLIAAALAALRGSESESAAKFLRELVSQRRGQ
jgi:hypothetical protein